MSIYKYSAIGRSGHRTTGKVPAANQEEAQKKIRNMGLRILKISEVKKNGSSGLKWGNITLTSNKVKPESLIRFFRQLATMLKAGIQLVDALEILEIQLQLHEKYFAKKVANIGSLVKAGVPLSNAMDEQGKLFPEMVISMIKAGEMSGNLDQLVDHIAHFIEKDVTTSKKINSAISYPKYVGGFMILILSGVVFFLLPKFEDIFSGMGADLPKPTQMIIAVSNFIKNNAFLLMIIVVALVIGYKLYRKSVKGRFFIDRYKFSLPIWGDLLHRTIMIRFSLTMGIMIDSGVGLIEALKIASRTADNSYIDSITTEICTGISNGESFGKLLHGYPEIFPPLESSMISVGEKSGSLTIMLEKVAEFNDQELSGRVETLSSVLEPLIMGGLGVVASILVLGLYLPIFHMSGSVH